MPIANPTPASASTVRLDARRSGIRVGQAPTAGAEAGGRVIARRLAIGTPAAICARQAGARDLSALRLLALRGLDLRPELQDRLREPLGVSLGGTEQVEGDPLGRFPAQSRKAGQLRDDRFQQGARILHGA